MTTRLRLPASAASAEPKHCFLAKLSFVKLVCEMLPGGAHLRSVSRSQTVCCRHHHQNSAQHRENTITVVYERNQESSLFSFSPPGNEITCGYFNYWFPSCGFPPTYFTLELFRMCEEGKTIFFFLPQRLHKIIKLHKLEQKENWVYTSLCVSLLLCLTADLDFL